MISKLIYQNYHRPGVICRYRDGRGLFPAGARDFSLFYSVQIGSGAHPASYPMGTEGDFPGGKAAGA
jgi:hypothetical protein